MNLANIFSQSTKPALLSLVWSILCSDNSLQLLSTWNAYMQKMYPINKLCHQCLDKSLDNNETHININSTSIQNECVGAMSNSWSLANVILEAVMQSSYKSCPQNAHHRHPIAPLEGEVWCVFVSSNCGALVWSSLFSMKPLPEAVLSFCQ